MLTLIYKKVIKKALEHEFISKNNALKLLNILKYGILSCEICKKPIARNGNKRYSQSIDHIIPKSKGGDNSFDNLRIAHILCNMKRKNGKRKWVIKI